VAIAQAVPVAYEPFVHRRDVQELHGDAGLDLPGAEEDPPVGLQDLETEHPLGPGQARVHLPGPHLGDPAAAGHAEAHAALGGDVEGALVVPRAGDLHAGHGVLGRK
jgi:hypothetical protein